MNPGSPIKKYFLSVFFILVSLFAFSTNEVIYIWSGGVTSTSINVNAKLTDSSSTIRLTLSLSSQFTSPLYSSYYHVDSTTQKMVAMTISGLTPNTKYYYAVESGAVLDSSSDDIGSFTTLQAGYSSFTFVVASCALNSDHGVFTVMKNLHPLFYSCMGDLHYGNPNSATDINVHRDAYENYVLSKPRAAAFFKEVPIDYGWDDHDFSGNDSDSTAAGRANARQAYREYVPHYPLPAGNGNAAIYQSFTVGRVHFIHTDLRSDRFGTSMMGAQQKAWFKNECIAARDSNQIIAWINSTTWNGTIADNWGGFPAERTELANFFRDNQITNMFMLCGDAHMLAIDNGTHGDFSTVISNNFYYPIFNAAALNQVGSYKGGTFSEGGYFSNPSPADGQFGYVTVSDNGSNMICISFEGFRCDALGGNVNLINSYQFCRDLGAAPNGIPEVENKADATLFPNPSTGKFVFETDKPLSDPFVSITDITGRSFETAGVFSSSPEGINFDLESFPEGVYFIKIVSEKISLEKKVVICK